MVTVRLLKRGEKIPMPVDTELIKPESIQFAHEANDLVFVAEENGRTVGVLIGLRKGTIGEIETFEKRKGVGRKLVEAFERWGKRRGLKQLVAEDPFIEALPFYKQLGFVVHERKAVRPIHVRRYRRRR